MNLLAEPETNKDPVKAIDVTQFMSIVCECEKKCGGYLRRYELVRCFCGRIYWALRPKRNGPMRLFPWPGDYKP